MTDNTVPESVPKKLNRNEEWEANLKRVQAFSTEHGRWPSTTAEVAEEKSLAQWWSRQKYYFGRFQNKEEAPGITDERAKAIQSTIEAGEVYERDGIWDKRFLLVANQLKTHGRLWSYKSENKEDLQVLRWWNQQKTFYRKYRKGESAGGMTAERAEKVEMLMKLLGDTIIPKPVAAPDPQQPVNQ